MRQLPSGETSQPPLASHKKWLQTPHSCDMVELLHHEAITNPILCAELKLLQECESTFWVLNFH